MSKGSGMTMVLVGMLMLSIGFALGTAGLAEERPQITPMPSPIPTPTKAVECPAPVMDEPGQRREFPNATGALSSLQTAEGLLGSAHNRTMKLFTSLPGEYNWEISAAGNEVLSAQQWIEQSMRELTFWIDAGYFVCPSDYRVDEIRQEVELSRSNLEVVQDLLAGCETDRCSAISQWLQEAFYHQARANALILDKPMPTPGIPPTPERSPKG